MEDVCIIYIWFNVIVIIIILLGGSKIYNNIIVYKLKDRKYKWKLGFCLLWIFFFIKSLVDKKKILKNYLKLFFF